MDQGKLVAAQALSSGVKEVLEAFAQMKGMETSKLYAEFSSFKFPSQEEMATPLKEAIESLRISITRTIYALVKQVKGRQIDALFITGPGAINEDFVEMLIQSLHKKSLPLIDHPAFGLSGHQLHTFALPIGLAFSGLPIGEEQVNFRKQEFAYSAPWKHLKQPMLIYFLLCLALSFLSLVFFGKAYITNQEAEIKKHYLDLLNVMNKPYAVFEKEYLSKIPTLRELASGKGHQ